MNKVNRRQNKKRNSILVKLQQCNFIVLGTSLKDDDSQEPNVQARQYQGGKGVIRHYAPSHMTPLEISMYVLLATFCCAIVVFVVSCVVYASKFKAEEGIIATGVRAAPVNPGSLVIHRERSKRETTTNAHDWVWLGRATLDSSNRNSAATANGTEIRITSNPLNMNYCDPDDCLATSFSNPSHIELPSSSADVNSNGPIDTNTYVRSKNLINEVVDVDNDDDDDLQVWQVVSII